MTHQMKAFIAALLLLPAFPLAARAQPDVVTPEEAQQIAAEAFIYTYPLVLMDITRRIGINFDAGPSPSASMHARRMARHGSPCFRFPLLF